MVKQSSHASDSKSGAYHPRTRFMGAIELSVAEAMWTPGPRPGTDLEEARNRFNSGPLHEEVVL